MQQDTVDAATIDKKASFQNELFGAQVCMSHTRMRVIRARMWHFILVPSATRLKVSLTSSS